MEHSTRQMLKSSPRSNESAQLIAYLVKVEIRSANDRLWLCERRQLDLVHFDSLVSIIFRQDFFRSTDKRLTRRVEKISCWTNTLSTLLLSLQQCGSLSVVLSQQQQNCSPSS